MKKALGTERVWLEQSNRVREKGRKFSSTKPTTSCFLGKHTTTVPRGRLQVVVDSNPRAGEQRERRYPKRAGPGHGDTNALV